MLDNMHESKFIIFFLPIEIQFFKVYCSNKLHVIVSPRPLSLKMESTYVTVNICVPAFDTFPHKNNHLRTSIHIKRKLKVT